MRLGFVHCRLLPVLFFACTAGVADATDGLENLLNDNPFLPDLPPAPPPPEPPPRYEFRGRSVENGVEYFTLYNLDTKKAFWISRTGGDLKVKEFSAPAGLVLVDQAGKTIRLALKSTQPSRGGSWLKAGTAVAATAPANAASPPVATALPATETQRLEQVADEIRARRTQRQQQAATRG